MISSTPGGDIGWTTNPSRWSPARVTARSISAAAARIASAPWRASRTPPASVLCTIPAAFALSATGEESCSAAATACSAFGTTRVSINGMP